MKGISNLNCKVGMLRTGLASIAILAFLTAGSANANDIPPGDDVWQTPPGGAEHDFSADPIPADFFEPGSDPFAELVLLQGAGTGCFDTVVRRLDPATPLPIGGQVTIDIEIVSLNLVSVSPITVSPQNDQWDVAVDLSPLPQPGGQMTIKHQQADGGTYDSSQDICPRLTFQRTTVPFDVRVFDVCQFLGFGAAVEVSTTDKPWTHNVKLPLNCPNSSPTFRPNGPHNGPHPGAQPVEEDATPVPGLTRFGAGAAILALVGTFAALRRRHIRA